MAKGRRQASRHGYVVIDKPAGWTSHDVVARVRRIVAERRVGHAGTLDPAATGVLPMAVGLATRTVEYLASASKAYRGEVTFGVTTDSADGDGEEIGRADTSPLTLQGIEAALEAFRGPILQRPPIHSAIKVEGKRLYELARQGVELDVRPRAVTIHSLTIISWRNPVLVIDVDCSKGTYIRSLARDLGEAVGTGAHLSGLRRTRSGPFGLDTACSLDELESALATQGWEAIALPPDAVLDQLPRLDLNEAELIDWGHGKPIALSSPIAAGSPVRAYDGHGTWRGVGESDLAGTLVRPVKVIPVE